MQAIEFTCEAQNGIISIPENYQDWFKRKSIKVILLAAEHESNEKTMKNTDLNSFMGVMQLTEDPLEFQNSIRSEWL
jgi:hypothetical protein